MYNTTWLTIYFKAVKPDFSLSSCVPTNRVQPSQIDYDSLGYYIEKPLAWLDSTPLDATELDLTGLNSCIVAETYRNYMQNKWACLCSILVSHNRFR